MRTIDFSAGWRANLPVILAVAGLSALWFYQRRGGRVQDLVSRGADGLRSAREAVNRVAPSVGSATAPSTTGTTPGVNTPGL